VTRTRAIDLLEKLGVEFAVHEYEVGESEMTYGAAVAGALGVEPERLFKTLVARVDGEPVVAIVPVSGRLSLKKLARAFGGKRAAMAETAEAERLTGYVVGGISPFAQRRHLTTLIDRSSGSQQSVYVSAGVRGLQIEISPGDLSEITGARTADLAE
jgi:Cys-tRNA(Pro)/Cys-tRNA(Cys) deacylase